MQAEQDTEGLLTARFFTNPYKQRFSVFLKLSYEHPALAEGYLFFEHSPNTFFSPHVGTG